MPAAPCPEPHPPATADRVRMKIREYAQSPQPSGHATARRACAFLIEGECSAYEVRPSACAAYHSVSKQRCEQSFHDPSLPSGTVALEALMVVALALEDGFRLHRLIDPETTPPDSFLRAIGDLQRAMGISST